MGAVFADSRGCVDNNGCIEGVGCPDNDGCYDAVGCPDTSGCIEALGCPITNINECASNGCAVPANGCYDLPVFVGGGMDWGLSVIGSMIPGTGIIDNPSLIVVILAWVKFFLILAGIIAFIAFLWAGAMYLTSFINNEHAEKGKNAMIYAGIGIIIILMSYALVNLFINASVD